MQYNDDVKAYLRQQLREPDVPFFDLMDGDVYSVYFGKNANDMDATLYEMFIVKAEPTGLNVTGLTTEDSSVYFRRLASMYRPTNSGILEGG